MYPVAQERRTEEPPLVQLLNLVRRHTLWIIVLVVLGAGVGVGLSLTADEVFESRAELLRSASAQSGSQFLGNSNNSDRDLENEVELMESGGTAAEVEDRVGRSVSVRADAGDGSDVIAVTHRSSSADSARSNLQDWTDAYVVLRRDAERSQLDQAADQAETAATELRDRLETVRQPLLDAETAVFNAEPGLDQLAAQQRVDELRQSIGAEASQLEADLEQLEAEAARLRSDAATLQGSLSVITPASTPSDPEAANIPGALIIGGVVGLLAGLGIAVARDQLDSSVRSASDLRTAGGGATVLGSVPRYNTKGTDRRPILIEDPRAPAAEAYRSLATSLGFLGFEHASAQLQITSPVEGDGKTTLAANLGIALARTGQQIIILDADLRRPALHTHFPVDPSEGSLGGALAADDDPVDHCQDTDIDGLRVLPAETTEQNPAELLQSDRARHIISRLSEACDILIIDSPPVLPVADALIIGHHVERAVMVTSAGGTSRSQVQAAVEAVRQVNTQVTGLVLNGVNPDGDYTYYRRGTDATASET